MVNVHGTIVAELAGAGNTDGTPGVASDRTPIYCSAYGAFVDSHEDLPDGEIRFSALMDAIGDCVLNGCKVVNLSHFVLSHAYVSCVQKKKNAHSAAIIAGWAFFMLWRVT